VPELYGGVETGGTWCVCALGTGPQDISAYERFATGSPAQTLDHIAEFFASGPSPVAIGVGSFGPVDVHRGSPTWGSVTTTPKPGWQHTSVAPVLRDRLDVPVVFDSDVNAAALGEHRWGAGRDVQSLCYLTVGTGIGAGLLIDGRPWHGLVHPEVGHMRIPHDRGRDPFAGSCPAHGDCWEGLAAGGSIAARWKQPPDQLPAEHPAWPLEADYLALGILNIVCVASPQRVIAGGGVMSHPRLLSMVRSRVRDLLAGYLDTPLLGEQIDRYLLAPGLGDRAGVLGAIALAQLGRETGQLSTK
jgi:fructokinase